MPTLGGPKPSHPQIGHDRPAAVRGLGRGPRRRAPAAMRTLTVSQGKAAFGEAQAIGDRAGRVPGDGRRGSRGLLVAWTAGAARNIDHRGATD